MPDFCSSIRTTSTWHCRVRRPSCSPLPYWDGTSNVAWSSSPRRYGSRQRQKKPPLVKFSVTVSVNVPSRGFHNETEHRICNRRRRRRSIIRRFWKNYHWLQNKAKNAGMPRRPPKHRYQPWAPPLQTCNCSNHSQKIVIQIIGKAT
jgi:hypothetical protein